MELCFKNINKFNLRKLKKKKTKVCNKKSLLLKNIFKKEIIDTRGKCDMKKGKMSKENDKCVGRFKSISFEKENNV